jgi:hypothetical protein
LLNLWGVKKSQVLQQFPIKLTLYIKNTAMWHERRLEMEISTLEGRILGFMEFRSGPYIRPLGTPLSRVSKFWEFI